MWLAAASHLLSFLRMSKDFYKILGLEKNASAEDIKRAYRKLAMQYHPDRGGGKEAEEKFKEINEAYQILSDPQKRAQYDQFGSGAFNGAGGFGGAQQGGFGGFDFSGFNTGGFGFGGGLGDIFEDFFGQAFSSISVELEIAPAQAVIGDEFKVRVDNEVIDIKIPAGTQNGTTFRIPGKGRPMRNGNRGDLNVVVKIKMPSRLTQEQRELWQKLKETEIKKKSWWNR